MLVLCRLDYTNPKLLFQFSRDKIEIEYSLNACSLHKQFVSIRLKNVSLGNIDEKNEIFSNFQSEKYSTLSFDLFDHFNTQLQIFLKNILQFIRIISNIKHDNIFCIPAIFVFGHVSIC